MLMTRYYWIRPRKQFLQAIRNVDPDGALVIADNQCWSAPYLVRGIPSRPDLAESLPEIKVKLAFLMGFAEDYGLGSAESNPFVDSIRTFLGWPEVSVEVFDRAWDIYWTDGDLVDLDESNRDLIDSSIKKHIRLPDNLPVEGIQYLTTWLAGFGR